MPCYLEERRDLRIICSTRDLFLGEVEKLKIMFFKNGYSMKFFDKVFSVFDNRQVNEQLNAEGTKRDIDFNVATLNTSYCNPR